MNNDNLESAIRTTMGDVRAPDSAQAAMDAAFASISREAADRSSARRSAPPSRRVRSGFFSAPAWARVAAVACAVCVGVGGTAYAADKLGLFNLQQSGDYQTMMAIDAGDEPAGPVEDYRLEFTSLPDDLNVTDRANYLMKAHWNPADGTGDGTEKGFSAFLFYLDSSEALPVSFTTGSTLVNIGNREGVLFEYDDVSWDRAARDLYVMFLEERRVLWLWSDTLSADEMTSLAENAQLVPTGETINVTSDGPLPLWSQEVSAKRNAVESEAEELLLTVNSDAMGNLHAVGDAVLVCSYAEQTVDEEPEIAGRYLTATVTSVAVRDNLDGLDASQIPEEWLAFVGDDGKLDPVEIRYVTLGDGRDSIGEVIDTETVPVKLVEATIEYENTGDITLDDSLVYGSLVKANESNGTWTIYSRVSKRDGAEDALCAAPGVTDGEMWYFTIDAAHKGGKNHIARLAPGDAATVTMAWLVPEDELDKLLLNLDGSASWYQFDKESLALGYVDIRQ